MNKNQTVHSKINKLLTEHLSGKALVLRKIKTCLAKLREMDTAELQKFAKDGGIEEQFTKLVKAHHRYPRTWRRSLHKRTVKTLNGIYGSIKDEMFRHPAFKI